MTLLKCLNVNGEELYNVDSPRARGCVDGRPYLNERVDHAHVGAGVEHFIEARFSVHQLQLVKLLIILYMNTQHKKNTIK